MTVAEAIEAPSNPLARAAWDAFLSPRIIRGLFDEDPNGSTLLYYARVIGIDSVRWKIGITKTSFRQRFGGFRSSSEGPLIFDEIASFRQSDGVAWSIEQNLIEMFARDQAIGPGFDGQFECFRRDVLGLDDLRPRDTDDELRRLLADAERRRERIIDLYVDGRRSRAAVARATDQRNEIRDRIGLKEGASE